MNDYLSALAARQLSQASVLIPRLPARFEQPEFPASQEWLPEYGLGDHPTDTASLQPASPAAAPLAIQPAHAAHAALEQTAPAQPQPLPQPTQARPVSREPGQPVESPARIQPVAPQLYAEERLYRERQGPAAVLPGEPAAGPRGNTLPLATRYRPESAGLAGNRHLPPQPQEEQGQRAGWTPSTPAQAPGEPAEPVIQITIGRIEVRAAPPPERPRAAPPTSPKMSLDDYLKKRQEGQA